MILIFRNNSSMVMRGTCAEGDVPAGDSGNVTGGDVGVIEDSGVEPAGGEGVGFGVRGAQLDNTKRINIDATK